MKKYFEYIDTLPINKDFTDTVEEKWYYRFDTKEFKYDCRNWIRHGGTVVGYLSTFGKDMALELVKDFGAKKLLRECGSKPESIFALTVLPYSNFPIHLDYHPNRTTMVYNVMVGGTDSETSLYDETGCVFKLRGIHEYHFNPNKVVHGAKTSSEPIQLLQFFYNA